MLNISHICRDLVNTTYTKDQQSVAGVQIRFPGEAAAEWAPQQLTATTKLRPAQHAYACLAINDGYMHGCIALAKSLDYSGSLVDVQAERHLDVVIFHLKGEISRPLFAKALGASDRVKLLEANATSRLAEGDRYAHSFLKLRVWLLTQYRLVMFLDTDTLALHSLTPAFRYAPSKGGVTAATDLYGLIHGWVAFNSGLFIIEPNAATYAQLMHTLFHHPQFGKVGLYDMDFLNQQFHGQTWTRLPSNFQVQNWFFGMQGVAPSKLLSSTRLIHFSGRQKPWQFTAEQIQMLPQERGWGTARSLICLWYAVRTWRPARRKPKCQ